MYYEITEARAHRFAEAVRDAGYKTASRTSSTPRLPPRSPVSDGSASRRCASRRNWVHTCAGRVSSPTRCCPTTSPSPKTSAATVSSASSVSDAGHHPRPLPGSGARQEGRLLEVHRSAGDAGRAQQGVAEGGGPLLPRGSHECLICLDACPIGREEHERRVKAYGMSRAADGAAAVARVVRCNVPRGDSHRGPFRRIDFLSANRLLSSCATCVRALCISLSLLHSDTQGASAPIG